MPTNHGVAGSNPSGRTKTDLILGNGCFSCLLRVIFLDSLSKVALGQKGSWSKVGVDPKMEAARSCCKTPLKKSWSSHPERGWLLRLFALKLSCATK